MSLITPFISNQAALNKYVPFSNGDPFKPDKESNSNEVDNTVGEKKESIPVIHK